MPVLIIINWINFVNIIPQGSTSWWL